MAETKSNSEIWRGVPRNVFPDKNGWIERRNNRNPMILMMSESFRARNNNEPGLIILGAEGMKSSVVDSGATNTVDWSKWAETSYRGRKRPPIHPCAETFRFGDTGAIRSLGEIGITVLLDPPGETSKETTTRAFTIVADIVGGANIPLLIPRKALRAASGILDFNNIELAIDNKPVLKQDIAPDGHMFPPILPPRR